MAPGSAGGHRRLAARPSRLVTPSTFSSSCGRLCTIVRLMMTGHAPTESINERRRRWRRECLPTLAGTVLDLGAGSGVAVETLPASVHWIALEPRPSRRLSARVGERGGSRLIASAAEDIPLADASVDAVIASTVLCSVADPARVLAEVRRVLRPGARLVFFEHVGSRPGEPGRIVERLWRPIARVVDKGCDPTRDTFETLRAAGFSALDVTDARYPGGLGTSVRVIHGAALA